jgi:hypothetical protein
MQTCLARLRLEPACREQPPPTADALELGTICLL